jgi:hypothetical protein
LRTISRSNRTVSLIATFLMTAAAGGMVPPAALAQEESFADRLAKNHYSIEVKDGRLTGPGAPILETALADAQFVLLGEDHGIAQIPQFDAAVCGLLGPKGFHDLAIEAGPTAAGELEKWLPAKDGRSQLVAFEKDFPETIAFYNWSEEYDFLSRCSQAASGGKFELWGLDQELMGASRILLSRILDRHLSPEAEKEGRRLLAENDEAQAKAVTSGNPGELLMLSASDAELAHFRETLSHEGNPGLTAMLDSLIESRQIYQKNMNGNGFDSNRQRALLMKSNFIHDYGLGSGDDRNPPKVIFKFGAWHLFKGINPLHNNDLGNLVTELADYQHAKSVHILIVAVRGKQLHFAGIGRPFQAADFNLAEDKDSDFLYLKPMFDSVGAEGLTLFDLRAFRKAFKSMGTVDREMERLIFGYDFLVLVPNAIPSTQIQ